LTRCSSTLQKLAAPWSGGLQLEVGGGGGPNGDLPWVEVAALPRCMWLEAPSSKEKNPYINLIFAGTYSQKYNFGIFCFTEIYGGDQKEFGQPLWQ